MPARHKVTYTVLNRREAQHYHSEIEVHASPEELQSFAESGYLIRERLFQGEVLTRLRDALDRLESAEWDHHRKNIRQCLFRPISTSSECLS